MNMISYARALYELAEEENKIDQFYKEFEAVCLVYERNPELGRFLDTPALSQNEQNQMIERVFQGQVHRYILYFLKILSVKRLSGKIGEIFKAYQQRYFAGHQMETAEAVTAVPMSEPLKKQLCEKLKHLTGKNILLKHTVDPSCLGGITITFANVRIDGTVKTKLEKIKRQLIRGSLGIRENKKGGGYESGGNQQDYKK